MQGRLRDAKLDRRPNMYIDICARKQVGRAGWGVKGVSE